MKKIFLLLSFFCLSGCIYNGRCWVPLIQVVSANCYGPSFPTVAHYQKPYSLGKTDSEQRWEDIVSCGGKYMEYNEWYLSFEKQKELRSCMLDKGYIFIPWDDCGYQSPKWDKGVCNL